MVTCLNGKNYTFDLQPDQASRPTATCYQMITSPAATTAAVRTGTIPSNNLVMQQNSNTISGIHWGQVFLNLLCYLIV